MKQNAGFNSELYFLSRFDAKHIFLQDIVIISQKEKFHIKWSET